MKAYLLVIPLLVLVAAADPTTIYVSPSGSDSSTDPSDSATPLATVDAAISYAGAFDQIRLAAGIYEESGLEIGKTLAIVGEGPEETIIRGAASPGLAGDRIFDIMPGHHVTIDGVTVSNGVAADGEGGGIRNQGSDLTLINSVIRDSRSADEFGGGGLFHGSGKLVVSRSTITANRAGPGGDGGGVLLTGGNALIHGSSIHDNRAGDENGMPAGDGGGLHISSDMGQVLIKHSRVCENHAGEGVNGDGGRGGGISNNGSLVILKSLLSGNGSGNSANASGGDGGAVFHAGNRFDLSNSTLTGNTTGNGGPSSGHGGSGSAIDVTQATGIANLRLNTITLNSTGEGFFFGGYASIHGNVGDQKAALKANIVHGNMVPSNGGGPDVAGGGIRSDGDNIIGGDGGFGIANESLGDMLGVDPLLQPLADNGGATETFLPGVGSPAIDAISCIADLPCDQRGRTRGELTAIGAADPNAVMAAIPEVPKVTIEIVPRVDDSGTIRLVISPTFRDMNYKVVAGDTPDVTVLGGLVLSSEIEGNNEVPILADIPFVSRLFKSEGLRKEKSFLVVFITPRIINQEE